MTGIPRDITTDRVADLLGRGGYAVCHVSQITKFADNVPEKTRQFTATIDKIPGAPDPLRIICLGPYNVRTQHYRGGMEVITCFRCLRFGHHASACKMQVRCKKCKGDHASRTCNPPMEDILCTNCGGAHVASSKNCPMYIVYLDRRTRQLNKTLTTSKGKQDGHSTVPRPAIRKEGVAYAAVAAGKPNPRAEPLLPTPSPEEAATE
ncbi:hypothetical protein J437_LFUL015828 [Ladona fulva]|uniref:Gag-like protein n=1 Tax=Ladona fulva TaxID=123851 RepID=A0A8K0P9C2_LADFU|nr:hypothetical protein J437_LFUL015828 [Ladona fulva]